MTMLKVHNSKSPIDTQIRHQHEDESINPELHIHECDIFLLLGFISLFRSRLFDRRTRAKAKQIPAKSAIFHCMIRCVIVARQNILALHLSNWLRQGATALNNSREREQQWNLFRSTLMNVYIVLLPHNRRRYILQA
jgi:hypothetical protein